MGLVGITTVTTVVEAGFHMKVVFRGNANAAAADPFGGMDPFHQHMMTRGPQIIRMIGGPPGMGGMMGGGPGVRIIQRGNMIGNDENNPEEGNAEDGNNPQQEGSGSGEEEEGSPF